MLLGLLRVQMGEYPVKTIHVVYSNHLDVGFNERSWNPSPSAEGKAACEGLFSDDGQRCDPLAANVTSEYFNTYFPLAVEMAASYRRRGLRYSWMAQGSGSRA